MKSQVIRLTTLLGAAVLAASTAQAQAPYAEGFETYATGSDITGQGGWGQWAGAAIVDNAVSTAFAHTGTKSLATELHADKIQDKDLVYGSLGGRWNWSVWTFVPSTGTTLPQWAIFLNDYDNAYTTTSVPRWFWNAQVELDPSLNQVYADIGPKFLCNTAGNQFGITAPLVVGSWREVRIDIDTASDRAQLWYDNKPIGVNFQWSDGITAGFSPNGATFGTLDLYANDNLVAADRVYWDDITITANTSTIPLECYGSFNVYCTAGTSQSGCVPTIQGVGTPSASLSSGFNINLLNSEGNKQGLMFYGINGQLLGGAPWGPGSSSTLCVKAPTQRTALQALNGTAGNCDATYSIDWNAYMAATPSAVGNPRAIGQSFDAQYWYRDNTAAIKSTSLSDALHFTLAP
jgi:hypothetical protein